MRRRLHGSACLGTAVTLTAKADSNSTFAGWTGDCAGLAASYGFGIAKNHAFLDGNKRAAFLSIGMFLSINGHKLVAGQVDAIQTMLAVAAGRARRTGPCRMDSEEHRRQVIFAPCAKCS